MYVDFDERKVIMSGKLHFENETKHSLNAFYGSPQGSS